MNPTDADLLEPFIDRWQHSSGNERANYQMFFSELCEALGVNRPDAKGSVAGDPYCFDKNITIYHPSGKKTPGYIDFYKADHFLIEAKQGGDRSGKGTAKRGTNTYLKAMEAAFVQAIAYTRNLSSKPPFLLTCDIGDHFELWLGFNGDYGGYGARRDIALTDLRQPEIFDLFVDIFTDPQKRNPEKIAAKVTREVAADLAELSKRLEGLHEPQEVAHFLMRCIFTMFAEDVGLLKEHLFTEALETRWLLNPKSFKPEVESLWQAMNDGTAFGFYGRLLRFNGGLFAESIAFDLTTEQLEVLLRAAKREWKDVEPAIFGTLLERALDTKERSKLGAHYTPRSYVERLVRPVVMEPLREQWDLVQGEVKQILGDVDIEPTAAQKKKAVAGLEGFLAELRTVRILDPACGSGNFLYVTLDLIKQLESEVLRRLEDVTGQAQLRLDINQVNPAQFLGIELNPRAAAIADLVIWIGYLQWHFRRFGDLPPVQPVLREYKNIECRDAVLAYDGKVEDVDPKTGKVKTRWGGRTMKHPVTGEQVPDPSDQIPIYRYINPRAAEWQEADYIVSNPPFIGKSRRRSALGNEYLSALFQAYPDMPEGADYVMSWWSCAANLVKQGRLKQFGFITTNSITQLLNRQVINLALAKIPEHQILWAIPDHPWVDSENGAAVRISMTVVGKQNQKSKILRIIQETWQNEDEVQVVLKSELVGQIHSDLRGGINLSEARNLKANIGICTVGLVLFGKGFLIGKEQTSSFESEVCHPFLTGRGIINGSAPEYVIDFYPLTEEQARKKAPQAFQHLLDYVKPQRDQIRDPGSRVRWWRFGRDKAELRLAIANQTRYIATIEVSKYRTFRFVSSEVRPDHTLIAIALEDAYYLGVLSSKIHVSWALAAGGTLEDRPRYNKTVCFDPFPFPDPTPDRKQKIRELGDRLDAHRKRVQALHPDVTITAMYNLLEKIRAGVELTESDRAFNNKALVSTLKQIHDELDAAVFEAYGWEDLKAEGKTKSEVDEIILERLVALNAERAEEERNGLIRWLRPEYQAPGETQTQRVIEGITEIEVESAIIPVEQQKFPKAFKDQLAAVRDLLRTQSGEWTIDQIAAQFKGATRQKNVILTCLESLETLGIVARYSEADDRLHWYLQNV
ncbi:MAG: class I SAM-dependent DNA methyltransferase [Leptolyngbya sp.]|nr:MAG: class I SAM-dependent DNA methyltransferase [Leptolyngbya sp.]